MYIYIYIYYIQIKENLIKTLNEYLALSSIDEGKFTYK